MFTIPESCPKELFPMNVYLSVGDLDIRNASGMELPVVREADNDWYSSGEISSVYQGKEPDYKFVYTADGPGVQRVYFENILNQENGYEGTLYIEAEYFETMRRKFKYSTNLVSITVQGLNKYDAVGSGVQDEVIYYRLVPQKKEPTCSLTCCWQRGPTMIKGQGTTILPMRKAKTNSCSTRNTWIITRTVRNPMPE